MELHFKNRADWRKWLEGNGGTNDGIWIRYFKKHTGRESILYNEAVEEALCFGWIDGKIKRIDEECYIQRFTPRRKGSRWSKYNIEKVERLIKEGKMTEAGMKAYSEIFVKPDLIYDNRAAIEPGMPQDLLSALEANKTALKNFRAFSVSARKTYIGYLNSAKRDKTRLDRIKKIVDLSEQNRRPGIM